jgi:hypothetical protein
MSYISNRSGNYQSYSAFEALHWTTFSKAINMWRVRTLKLPPAYAFANNTNYIQGCSIPYSAMWSPSFVPKPEDWPPQCEVVGTFVIDQKKNMDTTPFDDLSIWLANGPKPVFIGFGSMVIEDTTSLGHIIVEAAKIANVRVVVQSSWSKLNVEDGSGLCHNVGPCPHDWLLPQCCGVIHHGGAGTTAAGLRFGLPTFVCPFFADQFMWGYFVESAGVGPKACPVDKLTIDILVLKLKHLSSSDMKVKAEALSVEMNREDGIQGGYDHFVKHLKRDNMLCDVSLVLGEVKMARYTLVGPGRRRNGIRAGIKVSSEVAAILRKSESTIAWTSIWKTWVPYWATTSASYWRAPEVDRHPVMSHDVAGHVTTCHHGLFAGVWGLITGFFTGLFQPYFVSDKWARSRGAFGCLFGLVVSVFSIVKEFLLAILIFFDRFMVGCANGLFKQDFDYVINPSWKAFVHNTKVIESELDKYVAEGVTKARSLQLLEALDMAVHTSPYCV